jgi:Mor family transcriptional regulator
VRGRPAKTTHADRVLIRELYRVGREGPRPMSVDELAAKFGVSSETIYRVVRLDEIELEERRADEECCRKG